MATTVDSAAIASPMEYLPVALFGSTMGLTGLSIAWKVAVGFFGTPPVSFPLAASTIAAIRFAEFDPNWFTSGVAGLLLAFSTAIIAGLLMRTLFGVAKGELRTLST